MTSPTENFQNAWMKIKGLESELRAYELAFDVLKQALEQDYPGFSKLADDALAAAKQSPILAERMRKKYDEVLEKCFQQGTEVLSAEEVLRLLNMPLIITKVQ